MPRLKRIRPTGTERRSSRRIPAGEAIPGGSVTLAAGEEVKLVNVSPGGGLLIRGGTVLRPGFYVRLRLKVTGESITLGGRVRRCRVIKLHQSKIEFEAAIVLDKKLKLPLILELQDSACEPLYASMDVSAALPE
jgi:hypothetical protein